MSELAQSGCEWAQVPTVFVLIKFFLPTLCLKYNKVCNPYLKHTGSMTRKPKFAKIAFSEILPPKN